MAAATMTKQDLIDLIDARLKETKGSGGVVSAEVREALEESMRKQIEAQLAPLKTKQADFMERMLTGGGAPQRVQVVEAREKGLNFGLYVRAIGASALMARQGTYRPPEEIAVAWGQPTIGEAIKEGRALADARAKALAATDVTAGGFLVPTTFQQDVIEFLRPQSVVRKLGPMVIPMPTGSLRWPKITSGASASYQAENANATASQQALGAIIMSFKKLTALVPVSNDLFRYSSPAADGVVRDDVVRAIAQAENAQFIRGDGTAGNPKGLLNWALAANVTASAGTSLANMNTDLGAVILALRNANVPITRGRWIMSPRTYVSLTTIANANGFYPFRAEMLGGASPIGGGAMGAGALDSGPQGTLWGYPYGISTAVPGSGATGELYFADFADVVIGESQTLLVDVSMEAAYVDAAGNTISAYSQDQSVIRAITEHDLAVRRQESVAVINAMSY